MKRVLPVLAAILALGLPCTAAGDDDASDDKPRALAPHRFDFRPLAGWQYAPGSLTGGFVGGDVGYRIHRFHGLGLDFAVYEPFNLGPGAHPSWPLNRAQASFDFDYAFFPVYARMSGERVVQPLELWMLGGEGILRTEPVPVIDPANRRFDWNTNIDFVLAVGARWFLSPSMAVSLEVRDLIYAEKVESPTAVQGSTQLPPNDPNNPRNSVTWYDGQVHIRNMFLLRAGVSFLVP